MKLSKIGNITLALLMIFSFIFTSPLRVGHAQPLGDLTTGLVALYHMDEGSGSTVSDSSGNGNTATVMVTPVWVAGKIGTHALSFNGAENYALAPDSPSLDITSGITLSAWVKPDTASDSIVLQKGDAYELGLEPVGASGKVKFYVKLISATTVYKVRSSVSFLANGNTWAHLAATYNGSTVRLYLNSVLDTTNTAAFTFRTNTSPLAFAAASTGTYGYYKGVLDEVHIYSRALDPTEIGQLAGSVDLSMTKTDSRTSATEDDALVYTLQAANAGPDAATGAAVDDTLPVGLSNASWTCAAAGGANCPLSSGTGDLHQLVDIPAGGTVTYTLTASIAAGFGGNLTNTATITPGAGVADLNPADNSASDTDFIVARPVLAAIPAQDATEDELLTFTASAADPDGLPLTFSLQDAPSGAAIHPTTGVFTWTPTLDKGGAEFNTFKVCVSDGTFTVCQSVEVTVHPQSRLTALTLNRSTDQLAWMPVSGSLAEGYRMILDPAREFYYLDVNSLTANFTLADGYQPFYLDATQLPDQDAFYAYWAARGVVDGAAGWQGVMWAIIHGDQPMFYLKVAGSAYSLVDGLQHLLDPSTEGALRVSGDYPLGAYTFTGTLTGTNSTTSEISAVITFLPLPGAIDHNYAASEDQDLVVPAAGLLAGASDPGAYGLTAAKVSDPSHGTLSVTPDGSFSYHPNANYHGPDQFTYRAYNGEYYSNTATVDLAVAPVNDPPSASGAALSTNVETALSVDLGQLAVDLETSDANLTYVIDTPPAHGTLQPDGQMVTYTPALGFSGSDSFVYHVEDRGDPDNCSGAAPSCAAALASAPATVSLTVTMTSPVIASLDPGKQDRGSSGFTLNLQGTGFVSTSVVYWNGVALATRFVSATQLQAAVPAGLLARPGTVPITVVNPAPGGTSNTVTFTVYGSNVFCPVIFQ